MTLFYVKGSSNRLWFRSGFAKTGLHYARPGSGLPGKPRASGAVYREQVSAGNPRSVKVGATV